MNYTSIKGGLLRETLSKQNMKVSELFHKGEFQIINLGENSDQEIGVPYCCDLLSIAMSKLPADAAWVTVMGNVNTLAVAALTEAACVILAEGIDLDEAAKLKAKEQGITVLKTDMPIFDAALRIYHYLHA